MTRTCTSVLLCICLQQLERNGCSLTKMQLPTAMAEDTWVVLTVTCCPQRAFVLTGILVKANAEPAPGFKSLHYQSWPERLQTNFLECLILSFSICKWGKLRNKSLDLLPSSICYLNEKYHISLLLDSYRPYEEIPEYSHLASLKETPMQGVQLKSYLGDYQLPSHSMLFFG